MIGPWQVGGLVFLIVMVIIFFAILKVIWPTGIGGDFSALWDKFAR